MFAKTCNKLVSSLKDWQTMRSVVHLAPIWMDLVAHLSIRPTYPLRKSSLTVWSQGQITRRRVAPSTQLQPTLPVHKESKRQVEHQAHHSQAAQITWLMLLQQGRNSNKLARLPKETTRQHLHSPSKQVSTSTRCFCTTVRQWAFRLNSMGNVWDIWTRFSSKWRMLKHSYKWRPCSSYYKHYLSLGSANQLSQ